MSSIYQRLGFNFNTSKFHGDDQLTTGPQNYLNNANIRLNQWQINDIANNSVNGYYQNPYTTELNGLTVVLNNFITNCNTSTTTFTNAPDVANSVAGANVTGTVYNANYAAYAGNITIASQPNITTIGTLLNLTSTGNVNFSTFPVLLNKRNHLLNKIKDGNYINNPVCASCQGKIGLSNLDSEVYSKTLKHLLEQ